MSTTKTTTWVETKWTLPKIEVEDLLSRLLVLESIGSLENLHPNSQQEENKDRTELVVYFPDQDVEALAEVLHAYERDRISCRSIERIGQGDWATAWKAHFKPFFLASDVVVRPSWESYTPAGDEKIVVLDPGMAFGTGQHDSTRFCAEFLSEIRRADPRLTSIIDVGCGSGILALVAGKLGFAEVTGIDNDPEAVRVALENRARNADCSTVQFLKCEDDLSVRHPQMLSFPADVVVANIIAEALCELKPRLLALVKPGGLLVLSGILVERASLVEAAFSDLELQARKTSVEWCAYLYKVPNSKEGV